MTIDCWAMSVSEHVLGQQAAAHRALVTLVGENPGENHAVHSELGPTYVLADIEGTQKFHIICDALVVLALWAMERRRRLLS